MMWFKGIGFNGRMFFWSLALGIVFAIPFVKTFAQKAVTGDYVLVLNSYTSDAAWSNELISPIQEFAVKRGVKLSVTNMNMLMVNDTAKLSVFKNDFFQDYQSAPQAIVLLGNSSMLLRDDIKSRWGKDIPFILCAELDYLVPNDCYIHKLPAKRSERVPIIQQLDDYNLTFLYAKIDYAENVNLLKQMVPDLERIVLIGDGRYINQQLDYDLSTSLEKTDPNLKFEFISAVHVSTDSLLRKIEKYDATTTGVLFSSWFSRQTFAGSDLLMANSFQIIGNSKMPIFALGNSVMSNNGMIGGYFYEQKYFDTQLISVLESVLSGVAPRNIPFYTPDSYPIFDYWPLMQKGGKLNSYPAGSIIMNEPETFFESYRYYIFGVSLLLLLLIAHLYSRVKALNALRKAERKEIEANLELSTLFDNMPVLYCKGELLRGTRGEIVDVKICRVNPC